MCSSRQALIRRKIRCCPKIRSALICSGSTAPSDRHCSWSCSSCSHEGSLFSEIFLPVICTLTQTQGLTWTPVPSADNVKLKWTLRLDLPLFSKTFYAGSNHTFKFGWLSLLSYLWWIFIENLTHTHSHLCDVPGVTPENEGFLGVEQIFWLMTSNAQPQPPPGWKTPPRTLHVIPPKKCEGVQCNPYSNGAPGAINQTM